MNRRLGFYLTSLFAILLLTARTASAASPTTQISPEIAPFINGNILVVARLNPAAIDLDATQTRQERLITQALSRAQSRAVLAEYRQGMTFVRRWLNSFHNAGGTTLYCIVQLDIGKDDLARGFNPIQFVVPLGPNSDATAIEKLLTSTSANSGMTAIVANNAVFYGSSGIVDKLAARPPTTQPALADALNAGGDAPFVVAFAPNLPLKLLATNLLPDRIPPIPSGIVTARVIYGLDWISTAIKFGDAPSISTKIHCHDAASTAAFADFLDALSEILRQAPQDSATMTDPQALVRVLTPTIRQSTLALYVNSDETGLLSRLALRDMLPSQPPPSALAMSTASNVKQLMLAVILYTSDHANKYPDTIQAVAQYVGGAANLNNLLLDPAAPQNHPGFVYLKPASDSSHIKKPATWIVIHEVSNPLTGAIAVGFADGHVETMPASRLAAQLKAQDTP